ncbi:MAG TPA: TolC family protein [Bacteroidota bacterium]
MKTMVLTAALCFGLVSVYAQGPAQRQLTLDDAMRIALEQNITIRIAANNVESAENTSFSAYGAYVPQPYANASFNRSGISSPPTIQNLGGIPFPTLRTETYYNTYRTGFGLSYVLFDGFNREANLSSALTGEDQAVQQFHRTKQFIANSVQSTYLNVLRNEQLVKVAEENLKRDRRQLERITESNRVGASSVADVYRQQSIVANDDVSLISAQNTYDKSKADLLNVLALDPGTEYVIADAGIVEQIKQAEAGVEINATFAELSARALNARPDYLSTKIGVDLAENTVTRAWSLYYPTVSIYGGFSTNAQEFAPATSWSNRASNVGLTASWQLPEIFGSLSRIQNANISKRTADLQLEQKERDVRVEVKKALLDLEASRKQLEATQKSLVSAEQDRRVAEERYNLGAGTLLDLYIANANYVNAQANNVNANYNFIISRRNLEYVVGERAY